MAKDKSGKSLERAVARIQQMLDPGSVVTHNEWIIDRLGYRRQFDVVVRGTAMGRDYLGVIECKDWRDKVGTPEVQAFAAKARSVNAQIALMVSYKGFFEPGLTHARFEGVGTLSLLPDDPVDAGFSVGLVAYALRYEWGDLNVTISGPPGQNVSKPTDLRSLTLEGKRVLDWFMKRLVTHHSDATKAVRLEVKFKQPVTLQGDNGTQEVTRISVMAHRICKAKRGMVQATGDAMYDWQAEQIAWPIGGVLHFHCNSDMVAAWENYTGEIPSEKEFLGLILQEFVNPSYADIEVVDLTKYC
ncbi:MAG: restriction endonuclease [Armatimonadota bacterium]|nr:restriction endonuclease [Armatimonadota bacterium]